jgi:hypothetical protein
MAHVCGPGASVAAPPTSAASSAASRTLDVAALVREKTTLVVSPIQKTRTLSPSQGKTTLIVSSVKEAIYARGALPVPHHWAQVAHARWAVAGAPSCSNGHALRSYACMWDLDDRDHCLCDVCREFGVVDGSTFWACGACH